MFSQMERLNIINLSKCQCQWVLYEADVEIVRSPWGSLGSNISEREKRSREPQFAMHTWQGFSQLGDEFQREEHPLWEYCSGKVWPVPWYPLYAVLGGSLPWKTMDLAWKLRWILTSGGSIISVPNSKFVLLFFNQLIISFYF